MSRTLTSALIIFFYVFIIIPTGLHAGISEEKLEKLSADFKWKLIADNKDDENRIHYFLDGIIKDADAGIRLSDKLGLFLYDCRRHNISILKTRFFSRGNRFMILMTMNDEKADQLFSLYLEYLRIDKITRLEEAVFSIVLKERMKEIETFFKGR